ncbi:MAG: RimK/LysX family protein [Gammaproteobacteria bacterium]|nr:RimK/LysX family protein [Gammaproteobacteria bacterium]
MQAKVDTGADSSSIHAEDVQIVVQRGRQFVDFTLRGDDGRRPRLRRPLQRTTRIKDRDGGHQERPVVMLRLCVGRVARVVAVNLAQCGHFNYPLLLGRDYLAGAFIVDPRRQLLTKPSCDLAEPASP